MLPNCREFEQSSQISVSCSIFNRNIAHLGLLKKDGNGACMEGRQVSQFTLRLAENYFIPFCGAVKCIGWPIVLLCQYILLVPFSTCLVEKKGPGLSKTLTQYVLFLSKRKSLNSAVSRSSYIYVTHMHDTLGLIGRCNVTCISSDLNPHTLWHIKFHVLLFTCPECQGGCSHAEVLTTCLLTSSPVMSFYNSMEPQASNQTNSLL